MARHKHVLRDAGAVLLLWLLVMVFTWRIGLAGRVLAGGDIFTYFYPYWAGATRAIRAARLPLWNPLLFMGAPFLANSQVGFLYPLNWPLWLLFPPHRSVHLTVVLHLCLAASNAYLWGRESLDLGRVGAWSVGAILALGGYLGAQIEHVNQVQALAWLPLMLMLFDWASNPRRRASRRRAGVLGLAAVIALVLLAGHTQSAFISLVGLALYGCGLPLWHAVRRREVQPLIRPIVLLALTAVIGAAIAGAQIVPTWELSQHSVRARGLPLNERVSFSLTPGYVGRALLPQFVEAVPPDRIEHVAYVGVVGLVLAVIGLAVVMEHRQEPSSPDRASPPPTDLALLLLTFLGLFFALGLYNPVYLLLARFVPGFAHFRVPARWLVLYVVGVAALAGRGVQAVWERGRVPPRAALAAAVSVSIVMLWAAGGAVLGMGADLQWPTIAAWVGASVVAAGIVLVVPRAPRLLTLGLLTVLTAELYLAASALPHTRATAPQAFTSLRPALAHLLNARTRDAGPGDRFLSMSDTTFDPGDLALIETIYGPQLSHEQLYRYVIAAKEKEIVSPNLPLAFDVPAVDGFDGGVLPLERFVTLQQLVLAPERVSIDGRLRENLTAVPDGRWLSLFNVRYLITDKLRDAWIDDIFYDLQHGGRLSAGQRVSVAHVPPFQATTLGLVSHVEGLDVLPDGEPVGAVTLGFEDGTVRTFDLSAGEDLSLGDPGAGAGPPRATRLRWTEPRVVLTVTLQARLSSGTWAVRGLSLVDERTGSFQPLVVSDRGRFRLVHSGDVKIYENLDVLPRAFVVPSARMVHDDQAALSAMHHPAFDPSSRVVLHADDALCHAPGADAPPGNASNEGPSEPASADVTIVHYHPERVVIDAHLERSGYLVLTDAWYPGWQVTVDGVPEAMCRANLLFRAVPLDAGHHRLVFTFQPRSLAVGALVSAFGLLLLAVVPSLILRRWL